LIAYAVLAEPRVSLTYAIDGPGRQPARVTKCNVDDATQSTQSMARTRSVLVTLCFSAHPSRNGTLLIPYAVAPGAPPLQEEPTTSADRSGVVFKDARQTLEDLVAAAKDAAAKGDAARAETLLARMNAMLAPGQSPGYLMAAPDAGVVVEYTQAVARQFTLPAEGVQEAEALIEVARRDRWKNAALGILAGLIAGWLLVYVPVFPRPPKGDDAGPETRL
jgi:hypothetical protein